MGKKGVFCVKKGSKNDPFLDPLFWTFRGQSEGKTDKKGVGFYQKIW